MVINSLALWAWFTPAGQPPEASCLIRLSRSHVTDLWLHLFNEFQPSLPLLTAARLMGLTHTIPTGTGTSLQTMTYVYMYVL